jgi:predicted ATP-grasp superfamily ATP-dependent carboligase
MKLQDDGQVGRQDMRWDGGFSRNVAVTAPVLVVVATSARMLAQSARRAGLRPIALDLFGDLDTRRAARWISIANPQRKDLDPHRMEAALARLAELPRMMGWIAGGGFEDRLDVMEQCAQSLALIGNDACTVAAIKQPAEFFRVLDGYGIGHPETRSTPPVGAGWLSKRIGGTGGWHVRRLPVGRSTVAATRLPSRLPSVYYQRESAGVPMSALFLANGKEARLVGFNRLLHGAVGDRPYVFQGAIGPMVLPETTTKDVRNAVSRIAAHFELAGLNSIDFLLENGHVSVLEINPRPSATLALHDERMQAGLIDAHIAACRRRLLPGEELASSASISGLRIVYSRTQFVSGPRSCARLQKLGWCHDIGREGTMTASGDPLCSVSARAHSEAAVLALLAQRTREIEKIHEEENDY